jgi:HTH-type transcriptional regulator / antitoxin HigA
MQTEPNLPQADHPGRFLKEMLAQKGWTMDELAVITGTSRQNLSLIITGKRGVTPDMAVILAAAFGNTPNEWLKWDAEHQLTLVQADPSAVEAKARLYEVAPIREMQRRGWIKETTDLSELEAELTRFFGGPIRDGVSFPVATSRTIRLEDLNPAEKAWCFRARQLASSVPVAVFDRDRLAVAERKLRQLAAFPKEVKRLPQMLAYYGIRFVVVEPLAGARIDGAAFTVDDAPAIAVSVRWDRIDSFWFTVMHEFAHIKNGDTFSVDVNLLKEEKGYVLVALATNEAERLANSDAAATLIPPAELDSFISRLSPLYSAERIIQFAHKVKIHPGIIVGQLQHRHEIGYSAHRDFLVKVRAMITETALTDGWRQGTAPTGA